MVSEIRRVLQQLQGDGSAVVLGTSVGPDRNGIRTLVLNNVLPQSLAKLSAFLAKFFLDLVKAALEVFQLTWKSRFGFRLFYFRISVRLAYVNIPKDCLICSEHLQ